MIIKFTVPVLKVTLLKIVGRIPFTDVELKLTDLQGVSASRAFSDLLEDQVYDELLVEYVTSLDEVWFEPKHETYETP